MRNKQLIKRKLTYSMTETLYKNLIKTLSYKGKKAQKRDVITFLNKEVNPLGTIVDITRTGER